MKEPLEVEVITLSTKSNATVKSNRIKVKRETKQVHLWLSEQSDIITDLLVIHQLDQVYKQVHR